MHYQLTDHARTRMQQRAISDEALALVMEHGKTRYDHRGARLMFLPRKLRRRLLNTLTPSVRRRLEKQLDTYLVCRATEGQVITVGHRHDSHRMWRQ